MKQKSFNIEYKGITIIRLLDNHGFLVKDIEKREIPGSIEYQYIRHYGDAFREFHRYSDKNHRFSKVFTTLKSVMAAIDKYRIEHPDLEFRRKLELPYENSN